MININNANWIDVYGSNSYITDNISLDDDRMCSNCDSSEMFIDSIGRCICLGCGNDLTEQVKIN